MRIALAQMSMLNNMNENYKKTQSCISKAAGSQMLFFPMLQFSPYFPQLSGLQADRALSRPTDSRMTGISYQAKKNNMYISPNVYYEIAHKHYDASLFYNRSGEAETAAKLMHVPDRDRHHEAEYFDAGNSGFVVHETSFGKVGIVIGNDLHFPESSRICALKGADLILVPGAVSEEAELDIVRCELRAQAYENHVFMAFCNRTGRDGRLTFAGHSMIVDPQGNILREAGSEETILAMDIDLKQAEMKDKFAARRPEEYKILSGSGEN